MTEPIPDTTDGAEMPLPPALYPLMCVGGSYFLNKYLPLTTSDFLSIEPALSKPLALIVFIAAMLIMGWAISTLRASKTTLLPHKAVATLVITGPFHYSRNPIYLGFGLLLLAMFLSTLNLWLLILLPINIGLLQFYVILPEEKHLNSSFKTAYSDYQSRVRRWL